MHVVESHAITRASHHSAIGDASPISNGVGGREQVSSSMLIHGFCEMLCIATRDGDNSDILAEEGCSLSSE